MGDAAEDGPRKSLWVQRLGEEWASEATGMISAHRERLQSGFSAVGLLGTPKALVSEWAKLDTSSRGAQGAAARRGDGAGWWGAGAEGALASTRSLSAELRARDAHLSAPGSTLAGGGEAGGGPGGAGGGDTVGGAVRADRADRAHLEAEAEAPAKGGEEDAGGGGALVRQGSRRLSAAVQRVSVFLFGDEATQAVKQSRQRLARYASRLTAHAARLEADALALSERRGSEEGALLEQEGQLQPGGAPAAALAMRSRRHLRRASADLEVAMLRHSARVLRLRCAEAALLSEDLQRRLAGGGPAALDEAFLVGAEGILEGDMALRAMRERRRALEACERRQAIRVGRVCAHLAPWDQEPRREALLRLVKWYAALLDCDAGLSLTPHDDLPPAAEAAQPSALLAALLTPQKARRSRRRALGEAGGEAPTPAAPAAPAAPEAAASPGAPHPLSGIPGAEARNPLREAVDGKERAHGANGTKSGPGPGPGPGTDPFRCRLIGFDGRRYPVVFPAALAAQGQLLAAFDRDACGEHLAGRLDRRRAACERAFGCLISDERTREGRLLRRFGELCLECLEGDDRPRAGAPPSGAGPGAEARTPAAEEGEVERPVLPPRAISAFASYLSGTVLCDLYRVPEALRPVLETLTAVTVFRRAWPLAFGYGRGEAARLDAVWRARAREIRSQRPQEVDVPEAYAPAGEAPTAPAFRGPGTPAAGGGGPRRPYWRTARVLSHLSASVVPADMTRNLLRAVRVLHAEAMAISGSAEPLDADTLLPIIMVACADADLPHIHATLQFLRSFAKGGQTGEAAYYRTCVEAAVSYATGEGADAPDGAALAGTGDAWTVEAESAAMNRLSAWLGAQNAMEDTFDTLAADGWTA